MLRTGLDYSSYIVMRLELFLKLAYLEKILELLVKKKLLN